MRGPFIVLQDKLNNIQAYVDKKILDEKSLIVYKQLDLGDILSINGELSKTHTNALMIKAKIINLLNLFIFVSPTYLE